MLEGVIGYKSSSDRMLVKGEGQGVLGAKVPIHLLMQFRLEGLMNL